MLYKISMERDYFKTIRFITLCSYYPLIAIVGNVANQRAGRCDDVIKNLVWYKIFWMTQNIQPNVFIYLLASQLIHRDICQYGDTV